MKPKKEQNTNHIIDISTIFTIAIFTIFPLYYNNYYFDILSSKYRFYIILAIGFLSSTLLCIFINRKPNIASTPKTSIPGLPNPIRSLPKPDLFLYLFLLTATISTLQSDFPIESLLGNKGRHTGLLLLLLYTATYAILTKTITYKPIILTSFLATGILVCLFGITDYFNLNILGFKDNMVETQKAIYTSTIGNINTYTTYVALVISIAFILFCKSKQMKHTILYFVAVTIGFFAIIMGNSDNSYLALAALFGFAPFYLFTNKSGVKRYLIMLLDFLIIIKITHWITMRYPDRVIGIQSLFNTIAGNQYLPILCLAILLLLLFLYIYPLAFPKNQKEEIGTWLRFIWGGILFLITCTMIFLLYKANTNPDATYGTLTSYLRFSDSWGTNRGYIWRKLLEQYQSFSPLRKLFGYGPDTFGILMKQNYNQEMKDLYKVVFDSAHNEYLQYLITIGALGLLFYMLFLITSIYYMIKKGSNNPHIMAIVFAVIVYSAQAVVNINLPITAPIFMTLIMTGIGFSRNTNKILL